MSGDMRVLTNLIGGLGTASKLEVIDAHSKLMGDFIEARSVEGKSIFFTEEGAAIFDRLKKSGFDFEALLDPKGLFKLLAPLEKAIGSVK